MTKTGMLRVTVYPKRQSGGRRKVTQIDEATITDVRVENDGSETGVVSNGFAGFPVRRECGAKVWKGEIKAS